MIVITPLWMVSPTTLIGTKAGETCAKKSGVHKAAQVQQLVLWTTSPSLKVTEILLWRRLDISIATPYISKETYHHSSRMLPPLRYRVSCSQPRPAASSGRVRARPSSDLPGLENFAQIERGHQSCPSPLLLPILACKH